MSTFIAAEDYKPYIKEGNLTRLIEAEEGILEQSEDMAVATVRDALFQYYEVDTIFALTGNDRPKQVVRWIIVLSLYYLYERLPAAMMPQRIKDNYDEVMGWLKDIEDGKKPTNLPHKMQSDGTSVSAVTKFRWATKLKPRTHQL